MTDAPGGSDLSSNLEDYLETIWLLAQDGKAPAPRSVHAAEIAAQLGVTRASVTGALRALAERGLISYQPYRAVDLSAAGQALAIQILRRHTVLRHFFEHVLGVPAEEAEAAACRMEHAASGLAMERLIQFISRVNQEGQRFDPAAPQA